MVSIPTSLSTNKTVNSIISQDHVNDLQTGVRNLADEFNVGVTSRLKTFTSTATMSSLRIPSSSVATTSNLESGDVWNHAGVLKFYDGTATRNIVLSEVASPLSATTLSASGTTTLNGTTNITQPTTVSVGSINAFRVRTATNTDVLTVNTSAATVNVAGTLQISGASLLSPEKIHTAGFTFNIGNGEDVLTSGAQLPAAVLPYSCEIVAWGIYFPDGTSRTLTLNLEKSTPTGSPVSAVGTFSSILSMPITTATAVSASVSPVISLAQGDVLRLSVSGSTQATRAAVHIRVRKN